MTIVPAEDLVLLEGAVVARLDAGTDLEALGALADRLEAAGHVAPTFREAVLERERTHPTGLPTAIPAAIPHTEAEHVLHPGIALATLATPVAFGEMGTAGETPIATSLVVMLVLDDAQSQIAALQHLVARLQSPEASRALLEAADDQELRRRAERWLRA